MDIKGAIISQGCDAIFLNVLSFKMCDLK